MCFIGFYNSKSTIPINSILRFILLSKFIYPFMLKTAILMYCICLLTIYIYTLTLCISLLMDYIYLLTD